jgi:hypothetical protein
VNERAEIFARVYAAAYAAAYASAKDQHYAMKCAAAAARDAVAAWDATVANDVDE